MRFIEAALSGDNTLNSMEDIAASSIYEQAAAIVAGDPRFKVLADLTNQIKKLESLRSAHIQNQSNLISRRNILQNNIAANTQEVKDYRGAEQFLGAYAQHAVFESGVVNSKTYDKRDEFAKALFGFVNPILKNLDLPTEFHRYRGGVQVGQLNGLIPIKIKTDSNDSNSYRSVILYADLGGVTITQATQNNAIGKALTSPLELEEAGQQIGNILRTIGNITELRQEKETRLRKNTEELALVKDQIGVKFPEEKTLADLIVQRNQLQQEMAAKQEEVPAEDRLVAIAEAQQRHQEQAKQIALYNTPLDYLADLLKQIPKLAANRKRLDEELAQHVPDQPVTQTSRTLTQAPGVSRETFLNSITTRLPQLNREVLDKLLARGEQRQKGGLVLVESGNLDDITRVFAEKTGRTQDAAVQEIRGVARYPVSTIHTRD